MGAAVVAGTSGTLLGPVESGVISVILLLACATLALGATRWIPGLLFALTPAVCVFNTRQGFFPFDYVVFGLTGYLVLDALWRGDLRLPGPRSLHLAFLAVIASGLLTLFLARELGSFAGHLKRVIVGYLAMVVVFRFADRERWPWFALSIPVSGTAIALLVLDVYLKRGFLVHKAYELRTFYSNVGWGSSFFTLVSI